MSRGNTSRRGYVLLLTLGLLTLAAIMMTGVARHSIQVALAARDAERDLQHRWAAISCQRVLLDRADELLKALVPEDKANVPPWPKPSMVEAKFMLGNSQYWVILADEDAKANLNEIHSRKPDRLLPLLRVQAAQSGTGLLPIRLRPWAAGPRESVNFASFGQVFDLSHMPVRTDVTQHLVDQTTAVTCWGSRKLNFRRASDGAVDAVAGLVLEKSEVAKLLELRREWSEKTLQQLLNELDVRGAKLARLRVLLSDQSTCHSMWVRVEGPQRTKTSLLVANPGRPIAGDMLRFTW